MSQPATLPVDAGCTQCRRTSQQLATLATSWWECSHVDCPNRRPVTAAPPDRGDDPLSHEGSGCFHVRPRFPEY